jgi:hypothetical protein
VVDTVVVDGGESGGAPDGHVEAGVSERLEQHAADIARIEAELRAELERLRTDLYQIVGNVGTPEHSHAEIAALEERIATHEHELEEIADQVDEAATEDPPPAEPPPPPDTPPKRPHFLHKKLFTQ